MYRSGIFNQALNTLSRLKITGFIHIEDKMPTLFVCPDESDIYISLSDDAGDSSTNYMLRSGNLGVSYIVYASHDSPVQTNNLLQFQADF